MAGRIAKLRQLGNLLFKVTRLEGSRSVPNPFKILNLLQVSISPTFYEQLLFALILVLLAHGIEPTA